MRRTIPKPPLGPNATSLPFRTTMRNVFESLSFNLARVAAERAPGTLSHDCYSHSGARRGKPQPGALHFNVQKLSHRSIILCVRVYSSVLHVAADCCTCYSTPLWFPREETRFLLLSNIWFITIWNSTSVRLLCLKKSSRHPKEQGEKKKKMHQRGTALKLTAVIVLCHLVHLPWSRKGLIFYDVW